MVGGYNHNFRYKGRTFHVQTELSGGAQSQIVTLLYEGGTILASCKTACDDLLGAENRREHLEHRMNAQHKEMLRRLRDGELDANAGIGNTNPSAPLPDASPVSPPGAGASEPPDQVHAEDLPPADAAPPQKDPLEELVFAYLAGNDPRYK